MKYGTKRVLDSLFSRLAAIERSGPEIALGINLTDEDLKARADELERASRRSVLVLEEKSNGGVKAAEK